MSLLRSRLKKGADALDKRPQLAAALRRAKQLGAHIAVSKLDRLSRDVHFISGLMTKRVPFTLAKAKQRGVVLGNPNVGKMNTEAAAARDAKLKPVLEAMRGKPYREIAEGLTSRNIPTPRGGDAWNAMSVMRAMKRLRIAGK